MWEWILVAGSWLGVAFAHLLLWGACLCALALSCISISGTWLVVLAAIVSLLLTGEPGWGFIGVGIGLSTVVELLEWGASIWGIRHRGGSGLAGWAALLGGVVGMLLGTMVPPPLVGSLLGMLLGSFVFAYFVERRRLEVGTAAHVAMGAVMARIFILFLKIVLTLAMVLTLLVMIYR